MFRNGIPFETTYMKKKFDFYDANIRAQIAFALVLIVTFLGLIAYYLSQLI